MFSGSALDVSESLASGSLTVVSVGSLGSQNAPARIGLPAEVGAPVRAPATRGRRGSGLTVRVKRPWYHLSFHTLLALVSAQVFLLLASGFGLLYSAQQRRAALSAQVAGQQAALAPTLGQPSLGPLSLEPPSGPKSSSQTPAASADSATRPLSVLSPAVSFPTVTLLGAATQIEPESEIVAAEVVDNASLKRGSPPPAADRVTNDSNDDAAFAKLAATFVVGNDNAGRSSESREAVPPSRRRARQSGAGETTAVTRRRGDSRALSQRRSDRVGRRRNHVVSDDRQLARSF